MGRRRKPRKGEFVCTCGAYKFPPRFGGGRCSGANIVTDYWESHWGSGDCKHCHLHNRTEAVPYCEAVEGQEEVRECPVWQEFVAFHEIRVNTRSKKWS